MAGASDKTVKVTLIAVAQPYVKGVTDAGQATAKLGKDIDVVGGKGKGMESSLGGAGAALKGMAVAGAALAGTALVAFLRDSVVAAGNLEQSIGGVDAVFQDTAASIHDFGRNSAEAVGLSRNEFNQLITVTGAMLKNKGLEDFTAKSLDLVRVGADLAAQFGGSTAQAVEALNAAMRGENDPIEKYGISLSETAIKAELASKGLTGLTGAALEQAKAQARIDIVMRQSADAMGAFAREANTLQGQQQRLNAEWENAKAEIGGALLPAMTAVVGLMRESVSVVLAAKAAWDMIPGPVQAAVVALIAFRVAQAQLVTVGASTAGVVKSLGEALAYARLSAVQAGGGWAGLGAGLRTFTGSASLAGSAMGGLKSAGSALMGLAGGPWGIAIMGLTAAIGGYVQAQANATAAAEEFAATLDKTTGKFTAASREMAAQKFFKDFSQTDYSKVSDSLERAGVAVSDLIAAYSAGGPAVDDFKRKFDAWQASAEATNLTEMGVDVSALGSAYAALGRDVDRASEVNKVNADTQRKVADAATASGGAAKDTAEKTRTLTESVQAYLKGATSASDATNAFALALKGLASPVLDAREAARRWQEAIDGANAALEKNGVTLDITTEKGRSNEVALDAMTQAALNNASQMAANGASQAELSASLVNSQQQIAIMAQKFGMSSTEAANYAQSLFNIPKIVETLLKADPSQAAASINDVARMLAAIDGTSATTYIRTVTIAQTMDASPTGYNRAGGGPVWGPGTATSDSIPAWLSNGEFVIRTKAVEKYGLGFMHDLNAMRLSVGGFAVRGSSRPAATAVNSTGQAAFPSTLVVVDSDGTLIGRMRVEAAGVVDDRTTTAVSGARRTVL